MGYNLQAVVVAMGDRRDDETVGIISLGCPKNLVESEAMLALLGQQWVLAPPEEADIVIVNTCAFIEEARAESIGVLRELAEAKAAGRPRKIIAAGCLAQRWADFIREQVPQVDGFIGLDQVADVCQLVACPQKAFRTEPARLMLDTSSSGRLLTTWPYAYLRVAEGCSNPCSFCLIPSIRGPYRSRPMSELVREAVQLEASGIKELVLIAQDTTRYGEDLGMDSGLLRLVESLLEATSIPWIRLMYAYPTTLDMRLLDLMRSESRFLSYIDIPLQHVSRSVLSAMNRGGGRTKFLGLIDDMRARCPSVTIRSAFIVGFPTETPQDVDELVSFVAEAKLDHIGVFTYSYHPDLPAARLGDPISPEEKEARKAAVMETQKEISLAKNRARVGSEEEVLVESVDAGAGGEARGRGWWQAPEVDGTFCVAGEVEAGELVSARVTDAAYWDLWGEV